MGRMELKERKPAICIPVTGTTREELGAELDIIKDQPCQMIEWRADYLMASMEGKSFWETSREMLNALGFIKGNTDKPILFTIRTAGEGGEVSVADEDYFFINRLVADSNMAALIDIEANIAGGTDMVSEFIKYAHNREQKVVLSNHDFGKTPSVEEMTGIYDHMAGLDGDILKLAVMPENEDDVSALLEAAAITNEQHPEKPLVAISMGELGMISRICAGQFGGVLTFAAGKAATAPGQIDAVTLQGYLDKYYG